MTDAALPAGRFAEGEFHVGGVLNRTWSVLSRNFLTFFLVSAIANLPHLLLINPGQDRGLYIAAVLVNTVLGTVSQAMVVYGAFQQMRGQPASLVASLQAGWRRILPVIGLAITAAFLTAVGFGLLIVPGLVVITMLFVATPVCVVEQLDPFASIERSAQLTCGHRWKIFGLLLLVIPAAMVGGAVDLALETADGGAFLVSVGQLIWDAIWGAAAAVLAIATYHDLRVAKEGVDTEQIAAVFE
jgi:hypothetical protein